MIEVIKDGKAKDTRVQRSIYFMLTSLKERRRAFKAFKGKVQ
jgi:hypothetical protein